MMALCFLLLILYISTVQSIGNQEWFVNISDSSNNSFYYYWNQCVGSGHAALSLREDWRKWMKHGHDKINFSQVRFHSILGDQVGSVNGVNDYSFINIDKIYSYLLSINMKPYVEISYMPYKLASNPNDVHNQYQWCGSTPTSYELWYDFIKQWIQHLVDYFGINQVLKWLFEVWNEPNGTYASYAQYVKLYNATATAIKSVHKDLKVGGPTTSNFAWLNQFLNEILSKNIPIDFVATHSYPNQMKLKDINSWIHALQTQGIDVVDKYNAEYNLSLPLIISEYNSGCCMTPFGKFMNDDNYYAAAFLIFWGKHLQVLFENGDVDKSTLKWLSYWAISDVFDENDFNSNEFNNLYGLQTIRGIPKPAFRAFELFQKYGSDVEYNSNLIEDDNGFNVSTSTAQVYCLKNDNDKSRYTLFVANWNNYGFNITQQNLVINIGNSIDNKNELQSVTMYRIDENNTAPLATWIAMGSPQYPTEQQLQTINVSSQLKAMEANYKKIDDNTIQFELNLPIYGSIILDLQY